MTLQEYIDKKKELYDILLLFLENSNDENRNILFDFINKEKLLDNKDELRESLSILSIISKNHIRYPDFIYKIEQILTFLCDGIKQSLTNSEIFNIFKNNKRILLFLFEAKIISPSSSIIANILKKDKFYYLYFYQIIKSFYENDGKNIEKEEFTNIDETILHDFDSKCKIGENESYLCSLIRKDSIEEFIIYLNQKNISLLSEIIPSIFETNSFLLKNKNTSLIEYAAFFGSIQIFNYLRMNNVQLKPSLWIYAIHSKNAELISFLEDYFVKSDEEIYKKCIKEAIKCHHNDLANYFQNNLTNDNCSIVYGLKYHNYEFIQYNISDYSLFADLCKYDYFSIVKLLFKNDEKNMNDFKDKILNLFILYFK